MEGTPITAFTPRTTNGTPINIANAAPLMDSTTDGNQYSIAALTPNEGARLFDVLTAELYGVSEVSKVRAVINFSVIIPDTKLFSVTLEVNGNQQFTQQFTGTAAAIDNFSIEVLPDSLPTDNITYSSNFRIIFNRELTDYTAETTRYLLFASN